jgi:acyl-CoA thioesterase I
MAGVRVVCSCNFLLWHWVRFIFLIGCAAAALSFSQGGCGGSKSELKPTPPVERKLDTRPVIAAFGDSLTAGFGVEPGFSYPDFLQKDLDRSGFQWRVVNAGVSGDTTTDGVNRLAEVLSYKPRIVIVEFGGNDGLRGLPVETTRANLEQIVTTLRKAGATVVLAGMTLPPNYGPEYIRAFERIYVDLAGKYKLARIPFLLEGVATKRLMMQRDGLHPTARGNAVVAETVLHHIESLLK